MAKKRTKLDRSQRQSERLEKTLDNRPAQTQKRKTTREDFSQAAAESEAARKAETKKTLDDYGKKVGS